MYSFSPELQKKAGDWVAFDKKIRYCMAHCEIDRDRSLAGIEMYWTWWQYYLIWLPYYTIAEFYYRWKRRIEDGQFGPAQHSLAEFSRRFAYNDLDLFVEDRDGIFAYADVYKINKYAENYRSNWKNYFESEPSDYTVHMLDNLWRSDEIFYEMMMPFVKKHVEKNKQKFV